MQRSSKQRKIMASQRRRSHRSIKDRVSPRCSKARQCGGCTLQHLAYEKQLEYKFNKVKNCLERIGGLENIEEKMEPILGMEEPFYYRNKAQFPVGYDKEGNLITGFLCRKDASYY